MGGFIGGHMAKTLKEDCMVGKFHPTMEKLEKRLEKKDSLWYTKRAL